GMVLWPGGGTVGSRGRDHNPTQGPKESGRAKGKLEKNGAENHAPTLTHGDFPPEPVSGPPEPYDPRSYMAQSVPKRMAIISAGGIMDVIFAFIMATVAYALGVPETPWIGRGAAVGCAAGEAYLEPGRR